MPIVVILATSDSVLAAAWERQISPGAIALRLSGQDVPPVAAPGFSAIVVLDAVSEPTLPVALARCPTIFVGEPRSGPFEQARMLGRARAFLSYEESKTRLRELLPVLEELSEKQALVDLLIDKSRRAELPRPTFRSTVDPAELWDFLEAVVENLDSKDRLIAEFRRASRHLLHASHAVFFHREPDGFRADRGTTFFNSDDPIVVFFETHPAVTDGLNWEAPVDPIAELAVRNRMAIWGARLLIPVHDNGQLLGLVALGVRDDGQPYDAADRGRAVFFARLLRHALNRSAHFSRLSVAAEQLSVGAKYLPGTIVLGAEQSVPRHVPLVVRDLVGQVRKSRTVCRVKPLDGQPFRATAGIIGETGGVWAFWEEASAEIHETDLRDRAGRRGLLRELSLTVGHELGNALVSLATFKQVLGSQTLPASLIQNVKSDVAKLQSLNEHFVLMQTLHESDVDDVDVRDVVQSVGKAVGIRVEVGPSPVILAGNRKLLEFALRAMTGTVVENRANGAAEDIALKLRSTGSGPELIALVSIKGRNLELEGIMPEPTERDVPNLGRISVFLAKEILRLHHGEIHAGPGLEGTEILVSLRRW